jgi:hypothetical protein
MAAELLLFSAFAHVSRYKPEFIICVVGARAPTHSAPGYGSAVPRAELYYTLNLGSLHPSTAVATTAHAPTATDPGSLLKS